MDIWKELRDEGVDSGLLEEVQRFREAHPLTPEAQERVPVPKYLYYGREVWESAAAALLCGEHLLLAGPKATGKNVLAEDLAALFRDLRTKCDSGEISTKALDLRGLLAALHLIEKGIPSGQALDLGIINKAFEPFERQLVADAVWARLPRDATRDKLFD